MRTIDKYVLTAESTLFLIIDFQEKLCKAMDPETLTTQIGNVSVLLEAANELGIPVLTTEQYPAGLGGTIPELKEMLSIPAVEKLSFSCCGDASVMARIESHKKNQILVVGMETHICVLQTVLDLIDRGYTVHVVSDGVISRKETNRLVGLEMMQSAGAVITSMETVVFQLLKKAGTPEFKKLSKLIR